VTNSQTIYQIGQDRESVQHPLWTRDGKLVYFPGAEPAVAVGIWTEPTFGVSRNPVNVPGIGFPTTSPSMLLNHDSAPDGRFVIVRSGLAADEIEICEGVIIVQNWFEELKDRVPVD
jgi:hypothetical protein